jgi:hypothetical protein
MANDMAENILVASDADHESARERGTRHLSTLGRKHVARMRRVEEESRVANTWVRSLHKRIGVSRPRGAERMALTGMATGASHRAGAQHFQEEQ